MVAWGGVATRMLVTFIDDDGEERALRLDRRDVAIREIEIADVAEMESRAIADIAPTMSRAIRNTATLMVDSFMLPCERRVKP